MSPLIHSVSDKIMSNVQFYLGYTSKISKQYVVNNVRCLPINHTASLINLAINMKKLVLKKEFFQDTRLSLLMKRIDTYLHT